MINGVDIENINLKSANAYISAFNTLSPLMSERERAILLGRVTAVTSVIHENEREALREIIRKDQRRHSIRSARYDGKEVTVKKIVKEKAEKKRLTLLDKLEAIGI